MESSEDSTMSNTLDGAEEESPGMMTVKVQMPKERRAIKIPVTSTITDLRKEVSIAFYNTPTERLTLIFGGKILKDGETLEKYGIKHKTTVHLVIRNATQKPSLNNSPNGNTENHNGNPNSTTSNSSRGSDRGMLDMLGSDIFTSLLTSNPQMRQLMERNPELSHILSNPGAIRETIQMASNPAMMQELMRNQDRAMANIESIPGGFNALQRMYRDIQEPMLNNMQDQFGSNPFQTLSRNDNTNINHSTTGENTTPLPNPWSRTSNPSPNSNTRTSARSSSGPSIGTGSGAFTSGAQSIMQQLMGNPELMQSMLNSPMTQSIMRSMFENPELAANMMENNPLLSGTPEIQEQLRNMAPSLMNQLRNPATQELISNPEVLGALSQIQNGLQRLQTAAPQLFASMGFPNLSFNSSTTANGTPVSNSTNSTSTTSPAGQSQNMDSLLRLMNSMTTVMANQPSNLNGPPPEERFRTQLETLTNMGFVDTQANIQALLATYGDVNAAIERLINSTSSPGGQSN